MKKKNKLEYEDGTLVLHNRNRKVTWVFTPDELKTSPWKIHKRMNGRDCTLFLDTYTTPIRGITSKVNQRLVDIRIALRYIESEEKKELDRKEKYEKDVISWNAFYVKLETLLKHAIEGAQAMKEFNQNSPELAGILKGVYRNIGNVIADLPVVFSGIYTLKAYHCWTTKSKSEFISMCTKEHYWPRARAGAKRLVQHAYDTTEGGQPYTIEIMLPMVVSLCEVAWSTKKENNNEIEKQQDIDVFINPGDSYKKAKVQPVLGQSPSYSGKKWLTLFKHLDMELPPIYTFHDALTVEEADYLLKRDQK